MIRTLFIIALFVACNGDKSSEAPSAQVNAAKDASRIVQEVQGAEVAVVDVTDFDSTSPDVDVVVMSDVIRRPEEADNDVLTDVQPQVVKYPLDDILRINHIQAKGTHNSYHLKPLPVTIPDWDYDHAELSVQLEEQGVRQLELDIHKNDKGGFDVFHIPLVDAKTVCNTLKSCLTEVREWSDQNIGHHVLFILIEPKDVIDLAKIDDYKALDAAILDVWPEERLVRPDDVRGSYTTLREALENDGWPTLGTTRNKAMFIMLDGGSHRDNYLKTFPNLEGAVIFMRGGEKEPWACCLEYNNPVAEKDTINGFAEKGYLVRSDADDHGKNDEHNAKKAKAALATGAHYISSDMPGKTGKSAHFFDVTGGSPSRCNPMTAPPECTSKDIEALFD